MKTLKQYATQMTEITSARNNSQVGNAASICEDTPTSGDCNRPRILKTDNTISGKWGEKILQNVGFTTSEICTL